MARDEYLFTSESVTEGHPDKIADQISDAVLDAILTQDRRGRVACETLLTTGLVVVAGEITTNCYVDVPELVRSVIKDIGYVSSDHGFDCHTCGVITAIDKQSADIALGVDKEGAGDQGLMFGYACRETEELMPLPIMLCHRLVERLSQVRRKGTLPYLRPDGKSQVSVRYRDGQPVAVETVVVSTQHADHVGQDQIRNDIIEHVIRPVVPPALLDHDKVVYHINPTGTVRDRRADGRHRRDRAQDHRGHLRRLLPPRRRRLLRQGSDEGRPLGRVHGAPRRQEHRGGRAGRPEPRCRWPTPSASPSRSRS